MKSRRACFVGLLTLFVAVLAIIIPSHTAIIGGKRVFWLGDDAMISMRYAWNLAHGNGLVWNPGEHVEGFTNPLWTFLMAFFHLFPIPLEWMSLPILVTGAALFVVTVPCIYRLCKTLGGTAFTAALACALYALSQHALLWVGAGLETPLLTLLVTLSLDRVVREARAGEPTILTAFLMGALCLARADAAVLAAMLIGVGIVYSEDRPRALRLLRTYAYFLVLPAVYQAFRLAYYGEMLPNTAYLKTSNWPGRQEAGAMYTRAFTATYHPLIWALVPGVLWAAFANRRAVSCFAVVVTYMAYVSYAGGDAFEAFRFYMPVMPLIFILALIGFQAAGKAGAALQAVFLAFCMLSLPLFPRGLDKALVPDRYDIGNIRIAQWLRANTAPDALVADAWAGSVFYFSGRRGLDLLGKTDPVIAHGPVVSSGMKPGHNKFNYPYSLSKKPDYVIGNFRLPQTYYAMKHAARGTYAFTGALYIDPTFQREYLPNPVPIESFRTIFKRRTTIASTVN